MASGAKLEKAYLRLVQPSSAEPRATKDEFAFQFNPKEFTVQKSAKWKSEPKPGAAQTAMPQYNGAEPQSMSLEIFLDASESSTGDITKDVEKLFKCCTPLSESVDQNQPSPPFVKFGWGTKLSFTAFVKKVSAKYTMFKSDGTPIRAVCTLDVEEIPSEPGRQNPTSGALAAHRTHTVVAGDSLASIAHREYGDPRLWRAIAEANRIDDPLRLSTGTTLGIPPAEEATAFI
jgi:nucleoid-associated protein YgaU